MVAVFRKTTTLPPVVKSLSVGLVQLTVTCAVPPVALGEVTLAGDWLSMVTVPLAVSVPECELVLVNAVTVPVTVYVTPTAGGGGGAGVGGGGGAESDGRGGGAGRGDST